MSANRRKKRNEDEAQKIGIETRQLTTHILAGDASVIFRFVLRPLLKGGDSRLRRSPVFTCTACLFPWRLEEEWRHRSRPERLRNGDEF